MRVRSHARLPLDHQSVRFTIYVATIPKAESADQNAVRRLRNHARYMQAALQSFRASAIESAAVAPDPGNELKAEKGCGFDAGRSFPGLERAAPLEAWRDTALV